MRKVFQELAKRVDNPYKTCYHNIIKGREMARMKTVTVEKHCKWWYVIVREEGKRENLALASFTTKKVAIACRDRWAEDKGYKVV